MNSKKAKQLRQAARMAENLPEKSLGPCMDPFNNTTVEHSLWSQRRLYQTMKRSATRRQKT